MHVSHNLFRVRICSASAVCGPLIHNFLFSYVPVYIYTMLYRDGIFLYFYHTYLEAVGRRPEDVQALRSARYVHHAYPLRVRLAEQVAPEVHHLETHKKAFQ